MEECERCGKMFDKEVDSDSFDIEFGYLLYEHFRPCLCEKCAIQAIEDGEDGVYFETCQKCGCEFDLALEEARFREHFPWFNGTELTDRWDNGIMCADCAIEEIEEDRT